MSLFKTEDMVLRPQDIWDARSHLKTVILRTPLIYSPALSERTGCQVYLKMECWQICGCFKVRGAINLVSSLSDEQKMRGLVTASSGNHGIALSFAASRFGGIPVTVFAPEDADATKMRKVKALGAETRLFGANYLEALGEAQRYGIENGMTYAHSHAHPLIMAGQGTMALEILEDLPDVEAILVPIGGGGLVSGIALATKTVSDSVDIIGVEPTAAPGAYLSLRDGICREQIELKPSLADGLLGGFAPLAWKVSGHLIKEVVLVEEREIADAMRVFQQDEQLMLEGASSVGLAAMLSAKVRLEGKKVVLILTSRNIDANKFNRVMNEREMRN